MTLSRLARRRVIRRHSLIFLGWVLLLAASPGHAQVPAEPQAWLVTYGPGEVYWQRFGHNAIWIRDEKSGLDHVFNFGFFDFAQEGFLVNFIQGRLRYFAAARPAQVEFGEYINDNRSIRAQRLALDSFQVLDLADALLDEVRPENREYLYDYYVNNCSTRVRDAIDQAFGSALSGSLGLTTAPLNYRDHTRRLTEMDFWLYLGLEAGLASPVDAPITRWDEMFIPGVLADTLETFDHPASGGGVVLEDVVLYESTHPRPPIAPNPVWFWYLIVPAGLALAGGLAVWFIPGLRLTHLAGGWFIVTALLGCVLVYLWLCTDHWVTRLNLNLLLLNPLWALIPLVASLRRSVTILAVIAGVMSLAMLFLPPGQYNSDVIAAVLPANLLAAFLILKRPSDAELGH